MVTLKQASSLAYKQAGLHCRHIDYGINYNIVRIISN